MFNICAHIYAYAHAQKRTKVQQFIVPCKFLTRKVKKLD